MKQLADCSLKADQASHFPQAPRRLLYPDHILWKIGNREYKRPLTEVILDILAGHLRDTLGQKWAEQQFSFPEEERHVVMKWWHSFCELQSRSAGPDHRRGQIYKIKPSGDAMEFMSFADDLCQLRMADKLYPKMIHRLRNQAEFQGARYECAIAALFIRSGFEIKWQSGVGKKCEFVASHEKTGESIAIEVKSRRRPGTLNEGGLCPDHTNLYVDVNHLYKKAIGQCPRDMPCGIFIDVNLPFQPCVSTTGVPWKGGVSRLLSKHEEPKPDMPATETCLVFTNFGWHYTGNKPANGWQHVSTFPQYVLNPLQKQDTFVSILWGIHNYGRVPSGGSRL